MELLENIISSLEEQNVKVERYGDDYELSFWSEAGEEENFILSDVADGQDFADKLREAIENFDEYEHAALWVVIDGFETNASELRNYEEQNRDYNLDMTATIEALRNPNHLDLKSTWENIKFGEDGNVVVSCGCHDVELQDDAFKTPYSAEAAKRLASMLDFEYSDLSTEATIELSGSSVSYGDGAPSSIEALLEDAKGVKEKLEDLSDIADEKVKEHDREERRKSRER